MANACVLGYLLRQPDLQSSSLDDKVKMDDQPNQSKDESRRSLMKDIANDFDLSLFRKVPFLFHGIMNGFLFGRFFTTLIYLVPYAIELGISDLNASFIMSATGIGNAVIRLSPIALLIDKKIMTAWQMTGISFVIFGVSSILTPFLRTFTLLITVAAVFGLTWGVGGATYMVAVAQSAGSKAQVPGAQAWAYQQMGVGGFVFISAAGKSKYFEIYKWPLL